MATGLEEKGLFSDSTRLDQMGLPYIFAVASDGHSGHVMVQVSSIDRGHPVRDFMYFYAPDKEVRGADPNSERWGVFPGEVTIGQVKDLFKTCV